MLRYLKSEWYYAKSNWANLGLFGIYILVLGLVRIKADETVFYITNDIASLVFFLTCVIKMISYTSTLIENHTIRYYLDYVPNRTKLLLYMYIKYILMYVIINTIFYLIYYPFVTDAILYQVFIKLIIYAFHLVLGMLAVTLFKSTGRSIGVYFLVAFIVGDLVNIAFRYGSTKFSGILEYQPFYYVSVGYFVSLHSMHEKVLPFVYIAIFAYITTRIFKKGEY